MIMDYLLTQKAIVSFPINHHDHYRDPRLILNTELPTDDIIGTRGIRDLTNDLWHLTLDSAMPVKSVIASTISGML